jgi:serine/threonine protein kinase
VVSCDMTGSPLYMAPERILERPNNCAVDVWSSGVILFVLLVCRPYSWKGLLVPIHSSFLRQNKQGVPSINISNHIPSSRLFTFQIGSHFQAGYPPFWNEDVEKLFLSIVHGNYSFHNPYWSKVSDDVKDLIRRMVRCDEK